MTLVVGDPFPMSPYVTMEHFVSKLPVEVKELIESGPLVHASTTNPDGSPQVSVIWIGLDGDEVFSGHMNYYTKLRNMDRDPRVVLSFTAPPEPGVVMTPFVLLHARAQVERSDEVWDKLNRLTKIYMSPDDEFHAPKGPGYVVRYSIERVGGLGPWAPKPSFPVA
ncbi:MAG TPA: PPOX class F420-dependent oxidoreductase [Pseudonocardia sp.]|nr:PPOX class F420-dependent oxidoreductase [Pseudonocardia sp.]